MPRSRTPPYAPSVPGSLPVCPFCPPGVLSFESCAPAAVVLSCTHDRAAAGSDQPGRAGRDRTPGALAVHGDRPSREPGPAQPRRAEGRRPPGVLRLDGLDHDLAVVPAPARRRPGVGPAALPPRAA